MKPSFLVGSGTPRNRVMHKQALKVRRRQPMTRTHSSNEKVVEETDEKVQAFINWVISLSNHAFGV